MVRLDSWMLGLLAALLWLCAPGAALAQVSAGQMFCNFYYNLGNIPDLISLLAWGGGGAVLATGLFKLKDHSENPDRNTLSSALLRIAAGSGLIFVPFFSGWLVDTVFLAEAGVAGTGCTPGAVSTVSESPGLDIMLINFVRNIHQPMMIVVAGLAYILGAALIFQGLLKATRYGADRSTGTTQVVSSLFIGTLLIVSAQSLDSVLLTLFGESQLREFTAVAYAPTEDAGAMARVNEAIKAVLLFVQIVGWIAFVRGWLMLRNSFEGGNDSKSAAFTHIIGGALAINVVGFLDVVQRSFGVQIIA